MPSNTSGQQQVFINNRERAVSSDLMRLQAFQGKGIGEFMRMMLNAFTVDDTLANGRFVPNVVETSPLDAQIINGITPRPDIGTANLFIDPGVLCAIEPDSPLNADDSVYKQITDPGVQAAGALLLTANASGSTRIDVVECQINDVVLETDNRDIFNPSTGLFTPTAVVKVTAGRLSYRIRTGTPGAGYPGHAMGWLPLMVASVPNGSVTWDTVTCWDVRPLVSDAVQPPFRAARAMPQVGKSLLHTILVGGQLRLYGIAETTILDKRIGGQLGKGSQNFVDITGAGSADAEPGFAATNTPWYLYLCTPCGLPRWAMYTSAASGLRQPAAPRGIPVFTQKSPVNMYGGPVGAISMPTAYGFSTTGDTIFAVCVAAGMVDGVGAVRGIECDGKLTSILGAVPMQTILPTLMTDDGSYFTIVDGITHPANARALLVRFRMEWTAPGAPIEGVVTRDIQTYDLANTAIQRSIHMPTTFFSTALAGTFVEEFDVRIPLVPSTPEALGLVTRKLNWLYTLNAFGITVANSAMYIIGWELGP